jgi:hypothetical protein
LILNLDLIAEVDPNREVLETLKRLSRALGRCQQHESDE